MQPNSTIQSRRANAQFGIANIIISTMFSVAVEMPSMEERVPIYLPSLIQVSRSNVQTKILPNRPLWQGPKQVKVVKSQISESKEQFKSIERVLRVARSELQTRSRAKEITFMCTEVVWTAIASLLSAIARSQPLSRTSLHHNESR